MLKKRWGKWINGETAAYLATGIMTTLVDWASYALMRRAGVNYRLATVGSWVAAVLFAYVTNKFFVFHSMDMHPKHLWKEFSSFVFFRAATGVFTVAAMIVMVDVMRIKQDFLCKIVVSAVSLILNYGFSKLFIFRKRTE